MSNYVKSVDFAVKDTLITGDPAKKTKGTEVDTEFNNIATAIATKANSNGDNATGTWSIDVNGNAATATKLNNWVVAGGTADAITATYVPALTTLGEGQLCFFRATAANATTTPTFSPNGLTARTITKDGGGALNVGDIPGNLAEVILRYNLANTRWELMNPSYSTRIDKAIKIPCRVATTGNITTLAGGAPNVVNGVTLAANDRVFVNAQSTASQNGIYIVTTLGTGANGTWTRATDADGAGELLSGMLVTVSEGTVNADSIWMLTTNDPITIGTTGLTFERKDAGAGSVPNLLPNSGAQVAQRVVAPNLSTSRQIGQVDGFAIWASAGSVSAGTITQAALGATVPSGYIARAAGATLTGSAVISGAVRMEARDAAKYANKTCSFQINVGHDVGSAINYTIIVKKANAADDFGAMTTIATGSAISVPTSSNIVISFNGISMGDCSNGIEIEIQAACGAVTTKNFNFTCWSLEGGSTFSEFSPNTYEYDLAHCQRYLPAFISDGTTSGIPGFGYNSSTTNGRIGISYPVTPRVEPSGVSVSAASHVSTQSAGSNFAASAIGLGSLSSINIGFVEVTISGATANQPAVLFFNNASGWLLFTGAELF